MSAFDILPNNFFSILVSKNKDIYIEALLFLYNYIINDGGLEILIEDYKSSLISLQEVREFELEEDDDEDFEIKITPSTKANIIINRLLKTGWIDREFLDGSFSEVITPKPYAIPFIKLLNEVGEDVQYEYNSYVFSTYSGLKQAKDDEFSQMYEAIISAKKNTDELVYQLNTLYYSIKGHLSDIENKIDVNDLLLNHFEQFKKLSDNMYHPIKTMDSVHRYMTPIQNILSDILTDDESMNKIVKRAMITKKYEDEVKAEQTIVDMIDHISNRYNSLDNKIDSIDRKYNQYTKQSIEKIQYLMNADQSIKGKLTHILKTYASLEEDDKDKLLESLEDKINIERQEFLDNNSLYRKSVRRKEESGSPLSISKDDDFSEKAMQDMVGYFNKVYSSGKVKSFVESLLINNAT